MIWFHIIGDEELCSKMSYRRRSFLNILKCIYVFCSLHMFMRSIRYVCYVFKSMSWLSHQSYSIARNIIRLLCKSFNVWTMGLATKPIIIVVYLQNAFCPHLKQEHHGDCAIYVLCVCVCVYLFLVLVLHWCFLILGYMLFQTICMHNRKFNKKNNNE